MPRLFIMNTSSHDRDFIWRDDGGTVHTTRVPSRGDAQIGGYLPIGVILSIIDQHGPRALKYICDVGGVEEIFDGLCYSVNHEHSPAEALALSES
jgi:hypothetical protein